MPPSYPWFPCSGVVEAPAARTTDPLGTERNIVINGAWHSIRCASTWVVRSSNEKLRADQPGSPCAMHRVSIWNKARSPPFRGWWSGHRGPVGNRGRGGLALAADDQGPCEQHEQEQRHEDTHERAQLDKDRGEHRPA